MRQTADGIVGYAGLASCGRVWLCPVCNAKVMARRALEIGLAVAWAQQQGYHLIWGSLTLWHDSQSELGDLLDLATGAWRRVVSSKWWRSHNATLQVDHICDGCPADCERQLDVIMTGDDGRIGYIRALELTTGINGWHPHFHPLIVYKGTRAAAEAYAAGVVQRWVAKVKDLGGHAVVDGGQQLRVLGRGIAFNELGQYMTKQTFDGAALALELVWSQNKKGQVTKGRAAKTQPHWGLLAQIALGVGDHLEEVDRWQQLEEVIPGKRMIAWSRGLRRFAGVGDEVDDETIAAEEIGTREDDVCFLTPAGWAMVRDFPELSAGILEALEVGGWSQLRAMLDSLGIEYFTLEPASAGR